MRRAVSICSTASTAAGTPCNDLHACCCCRKHFQVLSIYPTTIRRRILRHLYLRHLRASYLFRWGTLSMS
jgi:hypothetical protein